MTIRRFANAEELALEAANTFVAEAQGRDRFKVALSGGSTPNRMYRHLRNMELDWSRVHVYWSDERFVPPPPL